MLNLSDKDLDRLSQEAAQQHEPGNILDPRFWEKLETRLDRDLGKINPNPARGIRRLPFYYAPAMLMLLGVSYYLVRLNNKSHKGMSSASPPLTLMKPAPAPPITSPSSQNTEQPDKSNSTPAVPSNTVQYPGTDHSGAPANSGVAQSANSGASAARVTTPPATVTHSGTSSTPGNPGASAAPRTLHHPETGNSSNNLIADASTHNSRRRHGHTPSSHPLLPPAGSAADRNTGNDAISSPGSAPSTASGSGTTGPARGSVTPGSATPGSTPATGPTATNALSTPASPRELTLSRVSDPIRLTHSVSIDDSALRAITATSQPRQPLIRKGGLHINRSLEIGLLGTPDFASVNSVAGDKPGSSFGLTANYKFAGNWYIGTGLLLTRQNYAAAPQSFHVPLTYYRNNGMYAGPQLIKGTLNMLEVPINLRYDFSTTGNTLFFATVGTSSYLGVNENCNYYYDNFGREDARSIQYPKTDYLFSTFNLSMGVEAGISNSLSLLIAPYVKIPTRNIGFGQFQLSSFGINVSLEFAPILSRKR